jgi:hypothetical protein
MMTGLMNEATRQPLRSLKGMKPRNGAPLITCRPQDIRGVTQQVCLSSEIRGFVVIALNGSPVAIDLASMKPGSTMSEEELKTELERLRSENAALGRMKIKRCVSSFSGIENLPRLHWQFAI